jgi:hypothetical protein
MVRPGARSGAFPLVQVPEYFQELLICSGVSEETAGVGSRNVIAGGSSGVGSLWGVKNGTTMSTGDAGPATGEGS